MSKFEKTSHGIDSDWIRENETKEGPFYEELDPDDSKLSEVYRYSNKFVIDYMIQHYINKCKEKINDSREILLNNDFKKHIEQQEYNKYVKEFNELIDIFSNTYKINNSEERLNKLENINDKLLEFNLVISEKMFSIQLMMDLEANNTNSRGYKKVNVNEYVKEGLENGTLVPRKAEKFARIIAKQGKVGEKVISWSVDDNGNEVEEKVDMVSLDEKTNEPGWIATKVDEQGNAIIDENGHLNQWIISDSTFKQKYEIDNENPVLFKPKGGPQVFVQISDNIILDQWGQEMKIARGGFINITNIDDMYGISERDFKDTYKFTDSEEKIL